MKDIQELQCIICYDVFDHPVTLYCGHTFCKPCILAFLAKSSKCPSCKTELFQSHNLMVDQSLEKIIKKIHDKTDENYQNSSTVKTFTDEEVNTFLDQMKDKFENNEQAFQMIHQAHKKTNSVIPSQNSISTCFSISLKKNKVSDNKLLSYKVTHEKIKTMCFKISRFQSIIPEFFPEYNHCFTIEYKYSSELFEKLMSSKKMVCVLPKEHIFDVKEGYLFEFQHVVFFKSNFVKIQAKCLGTIKIENVFLYNFVLNMDNLSKFEPKPDKVKLYYVEALLEKKSHYQMNLQTNLTFQSIEAKMIYFLLKLQKKNQNYYDEIVSQYNCSVVDQHLSISYKEDAERFLNVLINLLFVEIYFKKDIFLKNDLRQKLAFVEDFLNKTRPSSDPLFVICHNEFVAHQWAVVLTLLFFVMIALHISLQAIYGFDRKFMNINQV